MWKTLLFLIRKNLLVGVTVAIAIAIEEAVNIDEYFIALSLQLHWKLMDFQCNCKTLVISILDEKMLNTF